MAQLMENDIFRFVSLRAPNLISKEKEDISILKDNRQSDDTLLREIIESGETYKDNERIITYVKAIVKEKGYKTNLNKDERFTDFELVYKLMLEQSKNFDEKKFIAGIEQALKAKPKDYAKKASFISAQAFLWDSYYAFYILKSSEALNLEMLASYLRTAHLIKHLACGGEIKKAEDLYEFVIATPVIAKEVQNAINYNPSANEQKTETNVNNKVEYEKLWKDFVNTYNALKDVKAFPLEPETNTVTRSISGSKTVVEAEGKDLVNEKILKLSTKTTRLKVNSDALSNARSETKAVLKSLKTEEVQDVNATLAQLNEKLSYLNSKIQSISDPEFIKLMPKEAESIPGMVAYSAVTAVGYAGAAASAIAMPKIKPLGIGDLKVVKQKLQKYEDGEVAHIENVLKGESKERNHRTLDRTEEIVSTLEETNEETERDTQTTDRFELKKETEKTTKTDMSIQAGVTISASYGPVEIGAHAEFAYSTSSSESTKTAQNFARDVIDRSVSKIQKRVREERISKKLHEVEEINKHGFDNVNGGAHISGIYRWVDKKYKAQIYNYGKRMMFEFVIPEPAAFYIYAQKNDPAKAINLQMPQDLGSITHKDIQDWNYQTYIKRYMVQGVSTPPPFRKVIVSALDQSGMGQDATSSKSNKELVVPEGYLAKYASVNWSNWHYDDHWFQILVGNQDFDGNLNNEDNMIPLSIITANVLAYASNIEVSCERTPKCYEDWQLKTFEKIMAAYQSMKAQYEDKLAAAETKRGVVISGRNPRFNQETIQKELKKLSITMLTGEYYSLFNAMLASSPPEVNRLDAFNEGKFVQFFEQAFEWEQITYLFYPYFWGKKSGWVANSNMFDNDPLFTQFLQAGYSRVVVPVHPAYNDAILYYIETGNLWNGGESPRLDDPLFISIHEELKNQLDDLGNAVAEGDPWDVILPTTLVHLQQSSDLPDFTTP